MRFNGLKLKLYILYYQILLTLLLFFGLFFGNRGNLIVSIVGVFVQSNLGWDIQCTRFFLFQVSGSMSTNNLVYQRLYFLRLKCKFPKNHSLFLLQNLSLEIFFRKGANINKQTSGRNIFQTHQFPKHVDGEQDVNFSAVQCTACCFKNLSYQQTKPVIIFTPVFIYIWKLYYLILKILFGRDDDYLSKNFYLEPRLVLDFLLRSIYLFFFCMDRMLSQIYQYIPQFKSVGANATHMYRSKIKVCLDLLICQRMLHQFGFVTVGKLAGSQQFGKKWRNVGIFEFLLVVVCQDRIECADLCQK
eukprot:TRINITY_DN3197_c0_g1_i13.p1 TRINITY_DN3197_c0_g1~~TRINITY_DN3197_c0_g1_i13.p1  ORF type:complete len:302 (+),score=-7.81 TRINITY_DN3197_c0_g1_i13:1111-2016(+)